ncbi:MAG: AccI family restriction endonuclease [Saprospiraceae bacterium]|nr:AccI family restriction endonuclease [Saprospiraceae bacterium]
MTHPFEKNLSVGVVQLELELNGFEQISWADFWLNPRRLRGSDFLMRWSQGVWSENRLTDAINKTADFFALPYGPSGTAPSDDVRAYELYFERLESAGLGNIKRPDLLLFHKKDKTSVEIIVEKLGGVEELPFIPELALKELLSKAIIGIECENSLWVASEMPAFGKPLTPQKRLGGKPGLSKTSVLPTIIIKEEDRAPLLKWQAENNIAIHIWHVFFDRAYGLAWEEAERLVAEGLILPEMHYSDHSIEGKKAYCFYHHYAYLLGMMTESPSFSAGIHHEENGKLTPYTKLEGGNLEISSEALSVLQTAK